MTIPRKLETSIRIALEPDLNLLKFKNMGNTGVNVEYHQ
jgi:hypothetical protein